MDIDTPDPYGRTPLHLAIFRACYENKDEEEIGLMPCLNQCCMYLAQYLLRHGADPQKRDIFDKTPYDYANEDYIQTEQKLKQIPDQFFEEDLDLESFLKLVEACSEEELRTYTPTPNGSFP